MLWGYVGPLAVLCGCLTGVAHGEGVRDFHDGWLLNPRDTALILAPNPTAVPRSGWGLWGGAGQGALFSLGDLPLKSLEGGVIHRGRPWPWSVAGSWERLGERLMVEETGTVGLYLGHNPQLGFRMRARRWSVEGEKVDAGLESALVGRMRVGMGAGLTGDLAIWLHPGPVVRWHRERGRRILAEFKFFYPASGLALRLEQRGDGVPVLSLEIMVRLASGLGLGFRADPETGSLGGSLVTNIGGPWLRTSHLVHPVLGVTHRFHLGAGDPGACLW